MTPEAGAAVCSNSHLVRCTPDTRGVHGWTTLQEAARGSTGFPQGSRPLAHLDLCTPACRTHLGAGSAQGRATDTALLLLNPLKALPVSAAIAAVAE